MRRDVKLSLQCNHNTSQIFKMAAPVKFKVIKADSKIYLFHLENVFFKFKNKFDSEHYLLFLVGVEVPFKNCN